jgi:hypothetical protein
VKCWGCPLLGAELGWGGAARGQLRLSALECSAAAGLPGVVACKRGCLACWRVASGACHCLGLGEGWGWACGSPRLGRLRVATDC